MTLRVFSFSRMDAFRRIHRSMDPIHPSIDPSIHRWQTTCTGGNMALKISSFKFLVAHFGNKKKTNSFRLITFVVQRCHYAMTPAPPALPSLIPKLKKMNFVEEMTLYTMATSLICINQLLAELTPLQRDHLVGTRVAADWINQLQLFPKRILWGKKLTFIQC